MKTFFKVFGLALFLIIAFNACEKEEDTFCIDDILQTGTMTVGDISITVPGEQTYTGTGALPGPMKIGKYEGQISSVIIKQTPTETGMDVELRHYFTDGEGNEFWTHDHAIMTPLDATMTKFRVYDEMAVWVGKGDFECSGGMLINDGVVDFATSKLEIKVTGTLCGGGCD